MHACPCESALEYERCCGRFHRTTQWPASAEQLMRSRYSAFVTQNSDYLLASWHPRTRPAQLTLDSRKWLGLKILRAELTSPDNAIVEFVARSRIAGARADRLHETSQFVLEQGRWYYLEAV